MKQLIVILMSVFAFTMIGCAHGHHGHKGHGDKKACCKGKKWEKWKKMDADGDGAVSKAEFDKAHAEKFTAMDANKDGKVTMEEKKAYKKAKMAKKKKECCK